MAKSITLPHDPRTGLLDIGALLAFNRALYGAARMDGEGEGGTGGGAGSGGEGAGGEGGSGSGSEGGAASGEHGFPPNTPLEQMNTEQREAYWKHQSRKHENRAKAFEGLTPEKLKDLQDKAKKHDDLERELMSDKDKAVAEAKEAAERDAKEQFAPRLVRAEFRAALKGRVPDDQLDERLGVITDPLDLSKFLKDSGDVDTDKVTKFVDGIAPATGNGNGGTGRRGPSATGHGSGNGGSSSSGGALTGREMYEQRHKKKTTATA